MKKILSWGALALGFSLCGEVVLQADFNKAGDFSLKNSGRNVKAEARHTNRNQPAGKVGTAALFATQNLQLYPETKGKTQGSLRYSNIKNFPQKQGSLEFYFTSNFNENKRKMPHNYVFRCFSSSREGKSRVITMFIVNHKQITVQFQLSDGTEKFLYYLDRKWQPGAWKKIQIKWAPGEVELWVNNKQVALEKVKAELAKIDSLELGGIDNCFPLQGMIDEFQVKSAK